MVAAEEAGHRSVFLPDEGATVRLAQDIAAVAKSGDLIALAGGLGAAKTSFARALIRALAGEPLLEVPSPTFALRADHPLPRIKVVHADLYRLRGAEDLEELGLDEAVDEALLLVEWPELLPADFVEDRLDVMLEIAGSGRRAEIRGRGSWPARLARTHRIREFLDSAGWSDATRQPLAGDASARAYERIALPSPPLRGRDGEGGKTRGPSPLPGPPPQGGRETAILMNAPARAEGPRVYGGRSYDAVAHRALDIQPFLAIGGALRQAGVHAPAILSFDIEAGLALLEDLGSEGILDSAGLPIMDRYEAAIDLLVYMHGRAWPEAVPLPGGESFRLPSYDHAALLIEISLFPDWFGGRGGEPAFPKEARDDFLAAWSEVLDTLSGARTWVMRDFHSPNILWQPQEAGLARVGVIDFQDALIGDPAYDVASLAQDARAPLTAADEDRLKARYIAGRRAQDPGFEMEAFGTAYAVLAAQRATKVLGIFTRLALAEGKPGYQRHRARLKALLHRTLSHPVLSRLRVWYEPYL
jgi:tRNA threonylcarbamoyl adenosine modification protein YjeE